MDYNTGLKAARLEGRREGDIEHVHFCERLLNRPETPVAQLAVLPLDELTRLAGELQAQVLKQR